ncbi:MAG: selenocysteine-specific translation elongation factor [Syntrophobacteraceae bacterium]
MKQVVLGTAGHIDHGKTSLIRALTGIDTDRLKEEKLRGITIELGFAHMRLPNDDLLGIVDVPGHERFVRHMVAGATGIDLVALVIAADEGVMPQTREHMEICELLRVKKGLVVLTKIDLVDDPDWIEMVREDVKTFLKGTFLDGAPIIAVSSETGEGIEALRGELARIVEGVAARSAEGAFRLPVDRVFSIRGFGTVVTGTSISGRLRVGDSVTIYPSGFKTKVRGLQVHSAEVGEVLPGQRTAINLQGIERTTIQRGDVIAGPGALAPSPMLDVYLELLSSASRPVKNRAKVRFHSGTGENLATLVLLGCEELAPGQGAFAQLRFDQPIVALRGDRFVLRSYSPVHTIGGGDVLHPLPQKHKGQGKAEAAKALETLLHGDDAAIVLWHVEDAHWAGVTEQELAIRANVSSKAFDKLLQNFTSRQQVIMYDKENRRLIHSEALESLKLSITEALADYHGRLPLRPGMPKEELAALLPKTMDVKLYNYTLQLLGRGGSIVQEKELVRLASHKTDLSDAEQTIRRKIEEEFKGAGLQPPSFKEMAERLPGDARGRKEVLDWMLSQGVLVRIKEDLYFHSSVIEELRKRLIGFLRENGEISTPQFKDLTQASRKYMIPLLEYFDMQRLTIRVGDVRRLRDAQAAV